MTWVVDRNDHDGQGYKCYCIDNDSREFATFDEAREFVEDEASSYVDPMEYTWRIRPFEMDSSNAHLQKIYGKLPDTPAPLKVVIEVFGGVAEVTQCPPGVEVEIIDHDNAEDY